MTRKVPLATDGHKMAMQQGATKAAVQHELEPKPRRELR